MNKKLQFAVICPGGVATGGVELLHQLVDILNHQGHSAAVVYYPFFKKYQTPEPYKKYNSPSCKISFAHSNSEFFIIPETLTHLVKKIGINRSLVWWMSVDNYINSGSPIYAIKNLMNPSNYQNIQGKNDLNDIAGNLYQSEYAKNFLNSHNILNTLELSDYINSDYTSASIKICNQKKENIVVYNPAKGIKQTNLLIDSMPEIKFVPIKNLNRQQVIDLLLRAKIYIDFGNHPGKDRIPREAASLGCVVITNRKGSAMNPVDIPIPDIYKLNDDSNFFIKNAEELILSIFEEFTSHQLNFMPYRKRIQNEYNMFVNSALSISKILESNRNSNANNA